MSRGVGRVSRIRCAPDRVVLIERQKGNWLRIRKNLALMSRHAE